MLSTGYYIESKRKSKLFFRYWQADNSKICICLVHGLGEHSGRYEEWASEFVSKGISVCAIDLFGHGISTGKRGRGSFKKFYSNIDSLINETEKHYPNIPIIIYGHSLGGSIAINYYFEKKPKVSGLIITSPWFKLTFPARTYKILIAKLLKIFLPFLTVENGINPDYISRNKSVVEEYKTDKLIHSKISLKLYFEAVNYGKDAIGMGYMLRVPLLLMHGSADNITSCKSTSLFTRNTGKFNTLKIWEGCFHELHHEPNRMEVFEYIMNWMKDNFKK